MLHTPRNEIEKAFNDLKKYLLERNEYTLFDELILINQFIVEKEFQIKHLIERSKKNNKGI